MIELTQAEYNAVINAQTNVLNEIRARWVALIETQRMDFTNDDRQLNGAWLTLGAKPFSQRFFDKSLSALQGALELYPDPVDAEALKSALIKMNGAERK